MDGTSDTAKWSCGQGVDTGMLNYEELEYINQHIMKLITRSQQSEINQSPRDIILSEAILAAHAVEALTSEISSELVSGHPQNQSLG